MEKWKNGKMKRRVNHMVVRSFFRTFAKEIMNDKRNSGKIAFNDDDEETTIRSYSQLLPKGDA